MLDTILPVLLLYCFAPLGLNWRLQTDSGRSYERLKAICFCIAKVQWLLTTAATLLRLSPKATHTTAFEYPQIVETEKWRTIRIFKLHKGLPGQPLTGSLISCVFVTVYLWTWSFDMPDYEAISYRWDHTSTEPQSLILDGKLLTITAGLANMLEHLRLPEQDRHLWIDQICINQQDTNEKNYQVRRMGEIYANAKQVVAWLGKVSAAAELLLMAMDLIDDSMAQNRSMYFEAEIQPGQPLHAHVTAALSATVRASGLLILSQQSGANVDRSPQQLEKELVWMLCEQLLDNAWFERMWIMQEVVLANDVVMQAGKHLVPWRRLHGAIRIAYANLSRPQATASNVQAIAVIDVLRFTHCTLDGFSIPLARLLNFTRLRDAFDPRDKIYGLMGMITPWTTIRMPAGDLYTGSSGTERSAMSGFYLQKRVSGPMIPSVDYNQSVEQVYMDAVKVCLASGTLEALKDCCAYQQYPEAGSTVYSPLHGRYASGKSKSSLNLPSWATDWSLTSEGKCKSPLVDDLKTEEQPYHACGDHKADIRTINATVPRLDDPSAAGGGGETRVDATQLELLVLRGYLLDEVVATTSMLHTYGTSDQPISRHIWRDWAKVAYRNADPGPYGYELYNRREALQRTILADQANNLDNERLSKQAMENCGIADILWGGDLPPGFDIKWMQEGRWYYVDNNEKTTSWTHPREDELDNEYEQASERLRAWLEKYGHRHLNQRLFRTKRGYIGMSCQHVLGGDQVAILHGGRLPFLLRARLLVDLCDIIADQAQVTEGGHCAYELIGGECYIHGLVDGEALEIAQAEGLEAESILLH